MPSYYNLPSSLQNYNVEDVNRFNKLPFYLVKNEVKQFVQWNEFDQLFGKINWETNQGDLMKGVTPQRSPVGRSFFFPNPLTTVAKKDIYQVTESVEQAIVFKHKYESYQFNFLPSFNAFWDTYLKFANTDIVKQVACSNNQFIETQMWYTAPNVYLAGTGLLTGAPTVAGDGTYAVAGSKTAAWLVAVTQGSAGQPGVLKNLSLRDCYRAMLNLQEDMKAPWFEGVVNMPKPNEGLKGKYVIFLSSEAWANFTFDPDVNNLKPLDLNLLFEDFRGMLFGFLTCKIKCYPVRYALADIKDGGGNVLWAAGTPIDPEIFDPIDNKWKPNPYYTSLITAPYEIDWMLGADYARTIKVGPPPKEFAVKNMEQDKFYRLRWNGEVRLSDQVLIKDADGNVDLNDYGEQLKFKSMLTHGYLPGERRYGFPMLAKRVRPANIAA